MDLKLVVMISLYMNVEAGYFADTIKVLARIHISLGFHNSLNAYLLKKKKEGNFQMQNNPFPNILNT